VKDRAERGAWLEARGYQVVKMAVADVERDLASELDRLASFLPGGNGR
jgi:tRNA/rRNA methyltransferase